MPTNVTAEYGAAELGYKKAGTIEEKVAALKEMLATCPVHKNTEKLRQEIKTKLSKFKDRLEKEKKQKKTGHSLSIKKEGSATICLIGTTNTGKSSLLKKLTNSSVIIADYPFTTTKPEIGIMDYHGVKLQIIEIPSIIENFDETENGLSLLSIVRNSNLIILFFNKPEEKKLLDLELEKAEINIPSLIFNNQKNIKDEIWKRLNLVKIFTKEPGKKASKDIPICLKKNSTIEDMAEQVHKDFIKKFRFARIWGKSTKFPGQMCGINHKLKDDDIVELHLK